MSKDNVSELKALGTTTPVQYAGAEAALLEVFDNLNSHRDFTTEFISNEFTSLCPKTKQPDFATITIQYIPDKKCIETKSLKMYFLSFRNEGMFMETIVNKILTDLSEKCAPRWMKVQGAFNSRGGVLINVVAECRQK